MEFIFQPSPWPLFFDAPFLFPSFITPENYVQWTETPESHIYSADLPGVRKEEIRVEVEDNKYLIIRTEAATNEEEEEETKPATTTTTTTTFVRKFRLPGMIDVGSISASYEDGVLTVTVPRSFPRRSFRIDLADLPDRHEILAPAA